MILVKNKLKKIKKPIDDDDILNYLKYAHINHNKSLDRNDSEFDMIKTYDKSTQTENKEMEDKQIGVGEDELTDEFVKSYILDMKSGNFSSKEPSRREKQTQANAIPIGKGNSKSPPPSDDNDDEGFIGRNTRRGFRLAQLAYYASITGINIADAVIDMITSAPHHSSSDEEVAQPNTQQEVISVHSSPAISVHSSPPISVHSSSVDTVPIPTSPQSSRASSAKTTPRKTSK